MLAAISGGDELDPTSADNPVPNFGEELELGVAGGRIGYDAEWTASASTEENTIAIDRGIAALRHAGAEMVEVSMSAAQSVVNQFGVIFHSEVEQSHEDLGLFEQRAHEYGPTSARLSRAASR